MRRRIEVVADVPALAARAAELFAVWAAEAVAERGAFRVALSGGATPKALFERLRGDKRKEIPWDRVWFYWGDERCVPPEHPDSNYGMARRLLLESLDVPRARLRRMEGERAAEDAARRYEDVLRRDFSLASGQLPRLDLALMGLGADGHTASLFPGSSVVEERLRLARGAWMEAVKSDRITLTLPVFNAAYRVLFIAAGERKADAVRRALEGSEPAVPAALVHPPDGELVWLVDEAAAAKLSARRGSGRG